MAACMLLFPWRNYRSSECKHHPTFSTSAFSALLSLPIYPLSFLPLTTNPQEYLTNASTAPGLRHSRNRSHLVDPRQQRERTFRPTMTAPPASGGCCCCSCLKCLCKPFTCLLGCLCSCICKIICVIIVILGIICVILYFVFKPTNLKFEATDGAIRDFNLDGNNLFYDMNVKLDAINPNKKLGVKYERVEVNGRYEGERFAAVEMPSFKQKKKATDNLDVHMKGQAWIKHTDKVGKHIEKEKDQGHFTIDLKIYLKIRFRVMFFDTLPVKPHYHCNLKVPGPNSQEKFQAQECKYTVL